MRLNHDDFLDVVRRAPLVSVDLVIRDSAGRVLLGKRTNQPARGFWFVPGGVIQKGERIPEALRRVFRQELGQDLAENQAKFKGVYEHMYDENFASAPGISTHYIVLAHEVRVEDQAGIRPDAQHDGFRWLDVPSLLADRDVHPYTKAYFQPGTAARAAGHGGFLAEIG